jgi:hypothetical protein
MQQRDNRNNQQRTAGRGRPLPHGNGPARGNTHQKYESYLAKAREAQVGGDVVEMENYYQHAEHYWRVMRAAETGA